MGSLGGARAGAGRSEGFERWRRSRAGIRLGLGGQLGLGLGDEVGLGRRGKVGSECREGVRVGRREGAGSGRREGFRVGRRVKAGLGRREEYGLLGPKLRLCDGFGLRRDLRLGHPTLELGDLVLQREQRLGRIAQLRLELHAMRPLGLDDGAQRLGLRTARQRLALEQLAGVQQALEHLADSGTGDRRSVAAAGCRVDEFLGRLRALLGGPRAGLRKSCALLGRPSPVLGELAAPLRRLGALAGRSKLRDHLRGRRGHRRRHGHSGCRDGRRARREGHGLALGNRRRARWEGHGLAPRNGLVARRRSDRLTQCGTRVRGRGTQHLVDRVLVAQRLDQRLDLAARRDGGLDDPPRQPRELERRRRPVGIVQRDDEHARRQHRDRHGAEALRDIGRDQGRRLGVHLEDLEVDVVQAMVLGERARQVVLAEMAVVDEDLGQAAPGQRGLQRRLHRGRLDEPAGDDDVRQEAVRRALRGWGRHAGRRCERSLAALRGGGDGQHAIVIGTDAGN